VQELSALVGIVVALTFGAMSPGPSFVMVARTAASQSRANGLYAALGMGLGGLLFATASLLGLHGLLLAVPSLYWVLKIAGGLYLAYLGVHLARREATARDGADRSIARRTDAAVAAAGIHDANQQSENGDRLCERVRRIPARGRFVRIQSGGRDRGVLYRNRLVRDRRARVVGERAAQRLSALQDMDGSSRRRNHGRARLEARDVRGPQRLMRPREPMKF